MLGGIGACTSGRYCTPLPVAELIHLKHVVHHVCVIAWCSCPAVQIRATGREADVMQGLSLKQHISVTGRLACPRMGR